MTHYQILSPKACPGHIERLCPKNKPRKRAGREDNLVPKALATQTRGHEFSLQKPHKELGLMETGRLWGSQAPQPEQKLPPERLCFKNSGGGGA